MKARRFSAITLLLVVKNLSSLDVNALRPDGLTPAGHPYFRMAISDGVISAGQSSLARQIGILNSSNDRFDYEIQVLGDDQLGAGKLC